MRPGFFAGLPNRLRGLGITRSSIPQFLTSPPIANASAPARRGRHIIPGIVTERPVQETRNNKSRVTSVAGVEHRLDFALTDPLVQNKHSDAEKVGRILRRVSTAYIEDQPASAGRWYNELASHRNITFLW